MALESGADSEALQQLTRSALSAAGEADDKMAMGVPNTGWFYKENPAEMDSLGGNPMT